MINTINYIFYHSFLFFKTSWLNYFDLFFLNLSLYCFMQLGKNHRLGHVTLHSTTPILLVFFKVTLISLPETVGAFLPLIGAFRYSIPTTSLRVTSPNLKAWSLSKHRNVNTFTLIRSNMKIIVLFIALTPSVIINLNANLVSFILPIYCYEFQEW